MQRNAPRGAGSATPDRAEGAGWIHCRFCGNPCRAPARVGQYACPRCGRRLAGPRRAAASGDAALSGHARGLLAWRSATDRSPQRTALLVGVIALLALGVIGTTLARLNRAEGRLLVASGLTADPIIVNGGALILRAQRQLYQRPLSGGPSIPLTRTASGLGPPVVAEGWVYWVARPWRARRGIFEIHRRSLTGGTEEVLLHLVDEADWPPRLAVTRTRLFLLVNRFVPEEGWQARLLYYEIPQARPQDRSPGAWTHKRRELVLASGMTRPGNEFVVDPNDPDRGFWLRPEEWLAEGERPGALCVVSLRDRTVRRACEVAHPYALAQGDGTVYWLNDVFSRPRPVGPGADLLFRFSTSRPQGTADAVQLCLLPEGARKPEIHTLPHLPGARSASALHRGYFYWLAPSQKPDEEVPGLEVFRLSLATRRVASVTYLRSTGPGALCWLLPDRAGDGLFLCERYYYDNWFDWSAQGLSPRQLSRIWRLDTHG